MSTRFATVMTRRWAAAAVTTAAVGGCMGYALGWNGPGRPWAALPNSFSSSNADAIEFEALAQQLGHELIVSIFRDEETLAALTGLLLKTFTDPRVTAELKVFFKEQFTQDERTVRALKHFLVNDVLADTWVREELLTVSSELGSGLAADEEVWPTRTLETLGEASLEALQTPEFQEKAMEAAMKALRHWRS
jgi:hypothetical protein